ncbi:hypothetical protein J2S36_001070 [Arcanobacterium hippocoleae]|uniref:Uncharacterized protein n=1 Tax=Arcanobacterium hippocoleae TaxID=149017 RepID=A0ABU1T2C5_9ACTO|nr:hypothetical protein [Arcanobacterium hippocoleae]
MLKNRTKIVLLFTLLTIQPLICIVSISWYHQFFLPSYLRGDSFLNLHIAAFVAITIWSLLLAFELKLLSSPDLNRKFQIALPLLTISLYACITLVFFESLFSQYSVIFLGSWIIPVVTLCSYSILIKEK